MFRPRVVAPELWYPLLAFAHLSERRSDAPAWEPDPLQEVQRQAEHVLAEKVRRSQSLVQDSTQAIPQEGELTFLPEIPESTQPAPAYLLLAGEKALTGKSSASGLPLPWRANPPGGGCRSSWAASW